MSSRVLAKLRSDPLYHIENIQGCDTLLPFQKEVIRSVALNERTAIRSAHNLGKTFTASKVVLWFTSVFVGAKVISTAPTSNQVKRLLWSEIRAGYAKSKYFLGGEMLTTEWKIAEDWFAYGFTARSERAEGEGQGKASSFQGFHAPYILIVLDEATGIPDIIWKQLEGILTSGFVRLLCLGNPTTKNCEFARCFTDASYKTFKLSCFESPNFPANGLSNLDDLKREYDRLREFSIEGQLEELSKYRVVDHHMLSVRWVMRLVLKYGLNHPLVVSKALAEFPEEDEYTLIPLAHVEKAQYREIEYQTGEELSIGVDVARFGSDSTVLTAMIGARVMEKKVLVKRDTMEVSGAVISMIQTYLTLYPALSSRGTRPHVVIDATGIGSGVVDSLNQVLSQKRPPIPEDTEIRELHFGWGADALETTQSKKELLKEKYANMKAYIFVLLAQDIQDRIALPPKEQIYNEELPTIHYSYDNQGRWVIESKDRYKVRTGRDSPDCSDSLALANFGRYPRSQIGVIEVPDQGLPGKRNSTIIQIQRERALW